MPTKSKGTSTTIGLKNESNKICFVANKFNDFFCNIAGKLVRKLLKRDFSEDKVGTFYLNRGVKLDSFKFIVISEEDVEKLLNDL